jgi:lipopolysaccharide export system permease protein
MSDILGRYVFREVSRTWVLVTLVLMVILITNQFADVLGDAAANRLPRDAILLVMGLTSMQYLTILVPVGLFLACMLSLARLYHDSEMAALMACGIGPVQLYRPLFKAGLILAVVVGFLSLMVAPAAFRQVQELADQARRAASLGLLEPGKFLSFANGEAVLYAESVTPDGRLRNVFVQRRVQDRVEVVLAEEAWQSSQTADNARVLTFARGRRYEGAPGSAQFRMLEFAEHGIPYVVPAAKDGGKSAPAARSTVDLYRSESLAELAELHWRLSVPITLLVLVFLAVPLSRAAPRQGRFSGLASAVLVYIIYANLLAAGRGWLERGQVPAIVGLWWVHALFLLAGGLMLASHLGLLRRWWRHWVPAAALRVTT